MKKLRWYNSIKFKMPIILLFSIVVPIFIVWQYNYSALLDNVKKSSSEIIETNLANTSMNIEYIVDDIIEFVNVNYSSIESDMLIKNYIKSTGADRSVERSKLTLYAYSNIVRNRFIDSIYIMVEDSDEIITTIHNQKEIPVDSDLGTSINNQFDKINANKKSGWFSVNLPGNEGPSISYVKILTLSDGVIEYPSCSVIINLFPDTFSGIFEQLNFSDASIIITDFSGTALLGTNQNLINSSMKNNPLYQEAFKSNKRVGTYYMKSNSIDYMIVYYTSIFTNWKFIELVPISELYGSANIHAIMMLIILFIGIGIALVGLFALLRYVTKPINHLIKGMDELSVGNLVSVEVTHQKDELGIMLQGYNDTVKKLKILIDEVYVQTLLRREAQLITFQSQIDEHFLYNTLNSVYCTATQEKAKETANMIYLISSYFRLSLAQGKVMITVSEVVRTIKLYLSIQQLRFGDRLHFQIHVDSGADKIYVNKYIFQPIVENAIIHGIEKKTDGGNVNIIFDFDNEFLFFEVTDNGAGMSKEKLQELLDYINNYSKVEGENFALKNVSEQIRIMYGEEYKIKIDSMTDSGTTVSFKVPIRRVDDDTFTQFTKPDIL